jgi:uncharacterized protein YecE (DUF72 family)
MDGRENAMIVRVGTSGWSYKEWKGHFYPEKIAAKDMLRFYAGHFPSCEINNTFYRMPSKSVLEGWAAEVPASFRFVLKASQRITHISRLRDAGDSLNYLLETAAVLGERLGPFLFQLPPNFKLDLPRLRDFLALLPAGTRAAFEFRHATWFDDAVYEALRERNVALCIADTGEDNDAPFVATADWGYLRLRAVDYTDAQLADWIATMRRIGGGWKDAFVFFKHEERGTGPALAKRFEALLTP